MKTTTKNDDNNDNRNMRGDKEVACCETQRTAVTTNIGSTKAQKKRTANKQGSFDNESRL